MIAARSSQSRTIIDRLESKEITQRRPQFETARPRRKIVEAHQAKCFRPFFAEQPLILAHIEGRLCRPIGRLDLDQPRCALGRERSNVIACTIAPLLRGPFDLDRKSTRLNSNY